ncbi:hypothetical protein K438DRAFT_2065894 [Mycena galopus ATCC 62051]|nr:hypothetical protein K438DRAFT_2065894 [Mycena galopus ATCC 62051]
MCFSPKDLLGFASLVELIVTGVLSAPSVWCNSLSPRLWVTVSATASGSAKRRATRREPQPGETRQSLITGSIPEQQDQPNGLLVRRPYINGGEVGQGGDNP